jgi:O-antigen/teichoic acid export membrane protein
MGIIVKQTIKSSIFAYVGIALGFVTTALLMPKILTEAQVGLVRLLVSIMVLFSQISNLGFNAAGSRLFPYFRNAKKQHNGYLFWACIVTIVGLIITLSVFAINYKFVLKLLNVNSSPLLKDYLIWVFPLTIFGVFFSVFDNYARVLFDTVSGTFLREFGQRIFLFIAVLLYFFAFVNFSQFVAVYCVGLCLPTVFMVFRVWQQGNFHLQPIKNFWTPKLLKEFVSLSSLTFLSGFTSQVVMYLDQIQVTSIMSLSANGIYATMMMFGTVIYMPTMQISRIGGAVIAEAWKNNDLKTIREVYEKSCLTLLIIGSLLFICVTTNLHNIFEILPAYQSGYWVVIWIGLGKLFDMATGLNGLIVQTSKYYFYDTIFMLFLIVGTWLMNQWLIPIYGITGSAIATTAIILLFNVFRTAFVWFVFDMFPFTIKNIYVLIIAGFVFGLAYFMPIIPSIGIIPSYLIDTILRSVTIICIFGGTIYFTKISSDVNKLIDGLILKLLK